MSVSDILLQCGTICHVCCRSYERSSLTLIFSPEGISKKLADKICKYTPFTLNCGTHPSAVICTACAENMCSWDMYIQSCIETHIAFTTDDSDECIGFTAEDSDEWTNEVIEDSSEDLAAIASEDILSCISDCTQLSSDVEPTSPSNEQDKPKKKNYEKSRSTYCVAKWCSNNTGESNVSFFRIPKDMERAQQWLLKAGRHDLLNKDLKILHSKYLCGKHFDEKMFMNEKHKRLVWNAIPSIFPNIDHFVNDPVYKETTQVLADPKLPSPSFTNAKNLSFESLLML